MATLRELKDRGDRIVFYCRADVARCTHSWEPSWDQLIQYFGQDADFTLDRSEFGRLVCESCGGRGAKIIVQPPEGTTGMGGGYGYDHGPGLSVEEAALEHHARAAERKRLGIKSNAELNAESRAALKAARLADRKGEHFIGPPSPWAHRKRGRWL
jgi:hypothetical protein